MPHTRRIAVALDIQINFKNHTEVFAGVQEFADSGGWTTVIDNCPDEILARGTRRRPAYDGIIARVTRERARLVGRAAEVGVPVVNVMVGSPVWSQLPGAFLDFTEVGRLQAAQLLARGVRNFAFLGIKGRRPDELQLDGFRESVVAAGHEVSDLSLHEHYDQARSVFWESRRNVMAWMDTWKPPVGLACSLDDMARYAAQICHERGWRVPVDVAIIGTCNEEHLCEKPHPSLSSVELGLDRVGYEAARLLEELMNQNSPGRGRPRRAAKRTVDHRTLPPVGVVGRESTDFYATDDPIVIEAQAFIAGNYHKPIEVRDVAGAIMVSPTSLQNHFAAALQTTVAEAIRRARVERAKRELAGSDMSIDEVATRAGFTSNARLCETFRREVGMSPREYRRVRKPSRGRRVR